MRWLFSFTLAATILFFVSERGASAAEENLLAYGQSGGCTTQSTDGDNKRANYTCTVGASFLDLQRSRQLDCKAVLSIKYIQASKPSGVSALYYQVEASDGRIECAVAAFSTGLDYKNSILLPNDTVTNRYYNGAGIWMYLSGENAILYCAKGIFVNSLFDLACVSPHRLPQ